AGASKRERNIKVGGLTDLARLGVYQHRALRHCLIARHAKKVGRLDGQRLIPELVMGRDIASKRLWSDLIEDQMGIRMLDRRSHVIMDLQDRIAEVARLHYLNAELGMKLIR